MEDFIRENLQFGDPLIQCLLEKQSEAYEGSHLEMAVHKLASLCIKESAVKGITPSAIAAIGSKCMFFLFKERWNKNFVFYSSFSISLIGVQSKVADV